MANIDFIPDAQQSKGNIDFIPDEAQQNSPTMFGAPTYAYGNSFLSNLSNSPGVNAVLGAGDALRNTMTAGANLFPGVHIDPAQTGNGLAYKLGSVAGNIGGFVGGGEALDAARLGAEGIPMIGKALGALSDTGATSGVSSWLPGVARRAIGSAAYGGLTNQDNRGIGGAEGVGQSLIADSLPFGAGQAVKASQYFMPSKYMQSMLQSLGSGQTLEDATKSVIGSVKNAYENQLRAANELYDGVHNSVRNRNIYNEVIPKDPLIYGAPINNYKTISKSYSPLEYEPTNEKSIWDSSAFNFNDSPEKNNFSLDPYIFGSPSDKNSSSFFSKNNNIPKTIYDGQYPNLSSKIFDNYSTDLSDLHDDFIKNPTFQNAHELQSQLGTQIRALQGGAIAPDIATQNSISALSKARNSLKGDMDNFLQNENPELANQYKAASDYFFNNVAPYRADKKIYGMATGDITNMKPSSLGNVFAAPGENLQKVLSDLPEESTNNLLYTKLGQSIAPANLNKDGVSTNPDALLRKYYALDQQGLNSYINPELENQVSNLQNRMSARNSLQMALGGLLGAGLSHGHGGAPVSVGLGLMGAGIGKPVINYLQARLPLEQIAQQIGNVTRGAYPYARTAVLANTLNGANQ